MNFSRKFIKRNCVFFFITFTFSIALIPGGCQPTSGVTGDELFQFNLHKGKRYSYDCEADYTQKITDQETTTHNRTEWLLEVIDEKNDETTVRITYKRVRLSIWIMEMALNVDTNIPFIDSVPDYMDVTKMMTKMVMAIKDRSFTMKVNREGRIIAVEGFNGLTKSMMAATALPEWLKESESIIRPPFNEQNISEVFGRVFFIFPVKKIKPGEAWDKQADIYANDTLHITTRYTVKDIKANIATLNMSSELIPVHPPEERKGVVTGVLSVDIRTGFVTNAEMEENFEVVFGQTTLMRKGKSKISGKEL